MTENEAIRKFNEMRREFGWAGTIFTRRDVDDFAKRPLTDDEWNLVQASYPWRKGIPDRLTERGWMEVEDALRDAGVDPNEEA